MPVRLGSECVISRMAVGDMCAGYLAQDWHNNHMVNTGEHGSVDPKRDRQLDLPQVVDADRSVMALLGEEHSSRAGLLAQLDGTTIV